MSDKLGPLTFGEKEGEVFLGRDFGHTKNYSEATAVAIDEEIRRIVEESYARTREILSSNREALVKVSEALLERENLEGSELHTMVFGAQAEAAETGDAGNEQISPSAGPCVEQD